MIYLFEQFCVHVQQPPINSQSFNTVPLTPEKSGLQSGGHRTVCGVRARARLCHQLRGSLHHILVGSESKSSRGRSALGFEPWWTGTARGIRTHASGTRKECSFTTCSQCLATSGMISPAPCTMCQRCSHEALAKELRDSATMPFKLEEARENGTLHRAYWDHPVVKASSTPVLPVAVFMDGVAHSHTDSVLGVWAINMIGQKCHKVALIRKRQMCKCGCQGWCSQFPLMALLRWYLKATNSRQFCSKACLGKSIL